MKPIPWLVSLLIGSGFANVHAVSSLTGRAMEPDTITPILHTVSNTYHVARAKSPPSIDGSADEWRDVPAMVVSNKSQSGGAWNGPADLSGSLRLLWDTNALYFCLEVTDDVHCALRTATNLWENDGTQFAFDAYMNGPAGGYDPDELSFIVADSPQGPRVGAYKTRGSLRDRETFLPDVKAAIVGGTNQVRVYEWAMPWNRLEPVSPWILGRCGFTFTINDNDAKGFKSGVFWTRGILWGQDASRFGQLIFDGAPGVLDSLLELRAEPDLFGGKTTGRWLNIEGVPSFHSARLLVQRTKPGPVAASVKVCRPGETKPVAVGHLEHEATAGKTVVFAWDLTGLPDGRYELTFEVPAVRAGPSPRIGYQHMDITKLRARAAELRERFRIDRPWDDMADAPAVVRRHRGMVAALLQWLEPDHSLAELRSVDASEEHLQALGDCVEMLAAFDRGQDYLATRRNQFWSAYYSRADGSGQHFVTLVPADFNAKKTYPLIVNLHGRTGRPTPKRDVVHKEPYLEVAPWGRGDNGYTALGENDVLETIAFMKQWYRIDPDRVYITGSSMGGFGTWRLASRHPDLFAAAAPVCGGNDELPLENLRHVPVFNQHGQQDWVVSIDSSRYGVNVLQKLGYAVVHKEFPDSGHGIRDLLPVRDWLRTLARPQRPATITYTCDASDNGRAYWLTVRRVADPHAPATVTAHVTGRGAQQSLTLLPRNVAVLELDVAAMPVDRAAGLLVQVGESFLEHAAPLPERLFVVRESEQWSVQSRWSPPDSVMRDYQPGAAANLYRGEPLLIVYGTRGSTNRTEILRKAAELLTARAGSGQPMPVGRIPWKADTAVTESDLQHYNLILLGTAAENQIVSRLWAKLPFTVNEKQELLAGDREPVSLDGAGIRLCYFNPLSPKRLIFLVGTDAAEADARKWFENVPRLLTGWAREDAPDLVVQTVQGGDRRRMQFTHGWQWRNIAGADRRLPATMAEPGARTQAFLRVIQRTTGADFAFFWAPEPERNDLDAAFFTLADMAIANRPQQVQLGRVTGKELVEIHAKSVSNNKLLVFPALDPGAIDPKRLYTLALAPSVNSELKNRQKNLRDVEAAPDLRVGQVWREIFGK